MKSKRSPGFSAFPAIIVIAGVLILVLAVYAALRSLAGAAAGLEPAIAEPVPASAVDSSAHAGTRVGDRATGFTLRDQDGRQVSLYDYEGKVILLDISAMWCPPCRQEADESMALYNANKERGFVILTVLMDDEQQQQPDQQDCRRWANAFRLTYPVLADTSRSVWRAYDESGGVPLNLVIDREMVIRYKRAGYAQGEIETTVERILSE